MGSGTLTKEGKTVKNRKQEVRGVGGGGRMSLKIRKGNKEIWNGIRNKNC